jgi:D-amino-acid dehydrogenase
LTPWGLQLLAASRTATAEATSRALSSFLSEAMPAWTDLATHWKAEKRFLRRGLLAVYRSSEAFAAGRRDADARRRSGANIDVVEADAIRQMEPALQGPFAGALFHPDVAHVNDPPALTRSLVAALIANGLQHRGAAVEDMRPDGERVTLHAAGEAHFFDFAVLAAGIDSGHLARRLGCRVPLESERGYHVELPAAADLLSRPVTFGDRKFVLTPLDGRLRLAGTVEFGGRNAAPDWRRAELLLTLSREILPQLPTSYEHRWTGHRPSTPDSRPIIGAAAADNRILFAYGHGHLGLTLAAVTARRIAALIEGELPKDIAAFSPNRRVWRPTSEA